MAKIYFKHRENPLHVKERAIDINKGISKSILKDRNFIHCTDQFGMSIMFILEEVQYITD